MTATKSEIRDGMRIEWDVPIQMDDRPVLRALLLIVALSSATGLPYSYLGCSPSMLQ